MAPGDLKFDLDTAITMCRQGGYYQQAAYLAKKHGETELVVDILIEDSKSYDEALEYIWHQDPTIVSSFPPSFPIASAKLDTDRPRHIRACKSTPGSS